MPQKTQAIPSRARLPVEVDISGSTTTVSFSLFAPYNESVSLIGDFTDWKPVEMRRDDAGNWRCEYSLADGDYLYKFRVKSKSYFALEQDMDVFDPYALSITNDGSENTRLRIRDGRRQDVNYAWKHDDKPLPANQDLIIYELHVNDFTGGEVDGKSPFRLVVERLDYLKALGINCIELMPVKEFPGKGWGYSLRSLFAVENSYGTPEELCALVDEAHARGMRVIIDGVYNHADSESPLTKISYEYWFYKDNPDPESLHWGPKFNYMHFDENLQLFPARKYVIESIEFWVEKFRIDGIRFDATVALRDFNVLRELGDAAYRKVGTIKPFITIAEHIPDDPTITGRPDRGPLDAAWQDSLGRMLQAIVTNQERDGQQPWDLEGLKAKLDPKTNGYGSVARFVNFIGNHDFKRVMHMLGEDAKTFDEAAFRRMKLGTGLLMTAPGIPMLWMGQEFGFSSDKSLEPRPLDWTLLDNPRNADLLKFHQSLARLRHEQGALRSESFECVLLDQERLLFGFKRWDPAGSIIITLANVKDEPAGEITVENVGIEDGRWRDGISGEELEVHAGVVRASLDSSQVRCFYKLPA